MKKAKLHTNTPIAADPLLCVIISGCKFKYASYDFKKAYEEYKLQEENSGLNEMFPITEKERLKLAGQYMPKELKEKYRVWRIGKLRKIHFSPSGKAWKYEIGARYARTFYPEDFGVEVFPLV